MKIIDVRLRPPYKSFKSSFLYHDYFKPSQIQFRKNNGLSASEAVKQQSMPLLFQEMEEVNIVKAVVCPRVTDGGSNEELAMLVDEYPDKFIGMAHIEPYDTACALENITKFAVTGSCTGIYLEPGFRMEKELMHAHDNRLFPLYELCTDKNIPIILQYGGGKNSTKYYTPTDIDDIVENFPKLRIMISHGGWPQCMSFIHQAYSHEFVYLAPDCYFAGYPGSADYICAANGILQDKIVFGSAFPFYSLGDAVKFYHANLNDSVAEKVFYLNAKQFFDFND